MALKAKLSLEEHGALPEGQRGLYRKAKDADGKDLGFMIPDVEPVDGWNIEDIRGLKSAVVAARSERADFEGKLKAFEGLDAQASRDAITRLEEIASGKLDDKTKAQVEEIKRQLAEKHAKELDAAKLEAKGLESHLYDALVTQAATSALAKHGGKASVLLPHVTKSLKVVKEGDRYVARVVDEKGVPRITAKTGKDHAMDVEEYVETFKTHDDFKVLFASTAKPGSGTAPGGGGGGGGNGRAPAGDFLKTPASAMIEAGYTAAQAT